MPEIALSIALILTIGGMAASGAGVVVFYRHKRRWRYRANGYCPCRFCRYARGGF